MYRMHQASGLSFGDSMLRTKKIAFTVTAGDPQGAEICESDRCNTISEVPMSQRLPQLARISANATKVYKHKPIVRFLVVRNLDCDCVGGGDIESMRRQHEQ